MRLYPAGGPRRSHSMEVHLGRLPQDLLSEAGLRCNRRF
jgi:hypothetical protein